MTAFKGEVAASRRFPASGVAAAASPAFDPRGEGVSRNEPDNDSMVSSLTDDLLLFSVSGSAPASWQIASFRRFRFRPLRLRPEQHFNMLSADQS